eukprot:Phypoly_transcript_05274.p1 GENE.Phypoly_transcript_05274~~Phypoly_transcript_05274.p1  ORF type:complete len:560 (+),score=50.63 Phypoly_transcript_05274:285-1964(+)
MYQYLSFSLLLFCACVVAHNCTKKAVPQNYLPFSLPHIRPELRPEWEGLRVFADTSMLVDDVDACDRAGKFVRVGTPEGDEGYPACSSIITNDCWHLCKENDILTAGKAANIRDIFEPVINWLQSAIKVKRINENIRIPKSAVPTGCADHLELPEYYSEKGIPATDLILVVTGRPTAAHTVAWATECAADQTGRPVFGHVNIGPAELDDFDTQKHYIYKVLLHELTHVLGFNSYKFPFYIDPSGKPYASVTKTFLINGKKITKIITPRVVAAAKEHFGCPDIDGVPLEDGGDLSTSDSHWEKRIFRNEYMTGSSDHTMIISKITLALFEDMGWYRVDYERAESFEWGSGMGCSFVNGRCSGWEDREGYFCTVPGAQSCTSDRTAMGYCNLIRHRSMLPDTSRYFPDPYFGGSDELSDFCPYVAAFANGVCTDSSNQPANPVFGEHFGESSKCFESSLVKDGFWAKRDSHPMCYDYRCVGSLQEPKLEVQVGSAWHACPFSGQLENVPGFTGYLLCPNVSFCNGADFYSENERRGIMTGDSPTNTPGFFLLFMLLLFFVY